MCKYGIFVAKIYKYAPIDSFQGFSGSLDSAANCAALRLQYLHTSFVVFAVFVHLLLYLQLLQFLPYLQFLQFLQCTHLMESEGGISVLQHPILIDEGLQVLAGKNASKIHIVQCFCHKYKIN